VAGLRGFELREDDSPNSRSAVGERPDTYPLPSKFIRYFNQSCQNDVCRFESSQPRQRELRRTAVYDTRTCGWCGRRRGPRSECVRLWTLSPAGRTSVKPNRRLGVRVQLAAVLAELSQPCLPESCPDFSATFTTIAFDNSRIAAVSYRAMMCYLIVIRQTDGPGRRLR
jgi:hypothetical protein